MQINLNSSADGPATVTDGSGNPVTGVSRVMMEFDEFGKSDIVYVGYRTFSIAITAGDPVTPSPTPAPTPTPTPTPSPTPTPTPTS